MSSSAASEDRQARIAAIRQQIADGSYETADKLESALEAFLDREGAGIGGTEIHEAEDGR